MSYLVTGRNSPTASGTQPEATVYPRLEIRELREKQPEQFTLFIHALETIMTPEHRPKAARFADIAGIHGLPYERWIGDAVPKESPPEGSNGGYCYHESVLFPTWHRPYILLIEQSIGEVATRLAHSWTRSSPDDIRKKWRDAAQELRFPFWDWTDRDYSGDGLPDVLQPQTFTLSRPLPGQNESIQVQIDNPLALYDFNSRYPDGFNTFTWKGPITPQGISYFKDWQRTYRWPSSKKNPTDDYVKIKQKLAGTDKQRGSILELRERVSKLFTYPSTTDSGREATTWDEFSNTSFQSEGKTGWDSHKCGSLESPHNTVHLILGGIGNMSHNDYAAFDPIFYLHHCNIDRILAFWEYVYDKYWMNDGYLTKDGKKFPFKQDGGTWAADDENDITQTTDLQPFRKQDGTYWTSTDSRNSNRVSQGYTYPPIDGVNIDTPLPSDNTERNKTRDIYIAKLHDHFSNPRPSNFLKTHERVFGNIFLDPESSALPQGYKLISHYRRFVVQVTLAAHAFHGSYWVQLLHKEEIIGSFAVLSRGDDTHCAACIARNEAGAQIRGIIDIPEDVVTEIAEGLSEGSDSDTANFDNLLNLIKTSISGRVVGPGDGVLAVAKIAGNESSFYRAPLERTIAPNLNLLSAACATLKTEHPNKPVQFFNWIDHNNFFDQDPWMTA